MLVIWILGSFATVGQAQRAATERGGRIELVAPFVAKL
jgi:regulator of protease activity HflC (stomatin/prohibitin superfamily)